MDLNATVYMDTLGQITTNRSLASQVFEGYLSTSAQVKFRYNRSKYKWWALPTLLIRRHKNIEFCQNLTIALPPEYKFPHVFLYKPEWDGKCG